MTITVELQPEIERVLLAQAQLRVLSLQDYVQQVVVREAHVAEPPAAEQAAQAPAPASEPGNLVELFANSPVRGLNMDFERDKDYGREIVL